MSLPAWNPVPNVEVANRWETVKAKRAEYEAARNALQAAETQLAAAQAAHDTAAAALTAEVTGMVTATNTLKVPS